ncbi:MAG: hypothetical protein IKU03_05100 [Bacteroidales bacterium]|nr:hypothetical protein [Bacteroidales bacterium]
MKPIVTYQFIILVVVLLLTQLRCTTSSSSKSFSDSEKTLTEDTNQAMMDAVLSEKLQQHCSLWLNSWERGLKTDSFALVRSFTSPLSTDWEEFDVSDKNFSDYRDKIYYAPNGSYALDLYSYNLILNKKGAKIYAVVDADIQIYLIDIPHRQRRPVLFLGPSSSIDDGFWLSDSTVVLVGWERCFDCPEEAYRPDVLKVNVFTGETVEYQYNAAFPHYNSGFLKQKFPEIIFDD